MKIKLFMLLLVLAMASANVADARSPVRDPFEDPRCQFDYWVGQPLEKLQIALKQTKRPYRTAHYTHALTDDWQPERLTIIYDDEQKIKSISCQ